MRSTGEIDESGDPYYAVQRDEEKARNARTIVWIIFASIIVFACVIGAASEN